MEIHAASIFRAMNLFRYKIRLERRCSLRPRGRGKEMEPGSGNKESLITFPPEMKTTLRSREGANSCLTLQAFYGTQRFMTLVTRVGHWTAS
jgi:hypothetical protein